MKKLLAVLMTMVMTLSLFGCSSGPSKDELEKALASELTKICKSDSFEEDDTLSETMTKLSTAIKDDKFSSKEILDQIGSGTVTGSGKADFSIKILNMEMGGTCTTNLELKRGKDALSGELDLAVDMNTSMSSESYNDNMKISFYLDFGDLVAYSKGDSSLVKGGWEARPFSISDVKQNIPAPVQLYDTMVDTESFNKFGKLCDEHTEVTDEGDGKHALTTELDWATLYKEYKDNIDKIAEESSNTNVGGISLNQIMDVKKLLENASMTVINKVIFNENNEFRGFDFKLKDLVLSSDKESESGTTIKVNELSFSLDIDDKDVEVVIPESVKEEAKANSSSSYKPNMTAEEIDNSFDEYSGSKKIDFTDESVDVKVGEVEGYEPYTFDEPAVDVYENDERDTGVTVTIEEEPDTGDSADFELSTMDENDDHTFAENEEPEDFIKLSGNTVYMDVDNDGKWYEFDIPADYLSEKDSTDSRYSVTVYEDDNEYLSGATYSTAFGSYDSLEDTERSTSYLKETYAGNGNYDVIELFGATDKPDYAIAYYGNNKDTMYVSIYTHVPGAKYVIETRAFSFKADGGFKYKFEELLNAYRPLLK